MWTISRVLWLPAVVALAQMTDLCPAPCLGQTPTTEPVAEVSKWNSPAYVEWLEKRAMLHQARQQAANVSASGAQWRHEFGDPRPRNAVRLASVWLLDYPGSVITAPGKSVIGTWAEPSFWSALENFGAVS